MKMTATTGGATATRGAMAAATEQFCPDALRMCYLQPGLVQRQGDTYVCLWSRWGNNNKHNRNLN